VRIEDEVVRIARSAAALEAFFEGVESGQAPRPDWLHLQTGARLSELPLERWPALLGRIHRNVRRGFRTGETHPGRGGEWLRRWRTIASHGFHDFGEEGYAKAYDSPWVEDHDYIGPYLDGGLEALDAYAVYGSVLGSHSFDVEAFVATRACADVRTVIEPMAGTAEFAYHGHFRFPDFRYVMIDLDVEARNRVEARPWLPETEHHYFVSDVLDEEVWKQAKTISSGPSLAFVGKQSHQLFDPRQLVRLLELGTMHADALVLETPPVVLASELAHEEDLSRPEMRAAGLEVALVDEPDGDPNPFTNRLAFRLEARDASGSRTLFRYPRWTMYSPPTLSALAELQGIEALYFHSELGEFVPVDHPAGDTDCHDNVNFMLFTRDARRARHGA